VTIDQVRLTSSLSRRAAPAVVPLCLSGVGTVLSLTGAAGRANSAIQAVVWAVAAATILVPAWRERRLPSLIASEEGLRGPRGDLILRWEDVAGIWVGSRSPRWFPSALRPLTLLGWDAASLDFAGRADSRALPKFSRLIATNTSDQELAALLRRFTSTPVGAGEHWSRRRFLRILMN